MAIQSGISAPDFVLLDDAGIERRLVGMVLTEAGIPRQGYAIMGNGERLGTITSGTKSPTLGKAIGLGYVRSAWSKIGTKLSIDIRGREAASMLHMLTTPRAIYALALFLTPLPATALPCTSTCQRPTAGVCVTSQSTRAITASRSPLLGLRPAWALSMAR